MRTTLSSLPNTPFAFRKGINAARREKGALFPKEAACSCLLPLSKKNSQLAAFAVITSLPKEKPANLAA